MEHYLFRYILEILTKKRQGRIQTFSGGGVEYKMFRWVRYIKWAKLLHSLSVKKKCDF